MAEAARGERQFVGEALHPAAGAGDAGAMARGEPGVPARFTWRDRQWDVAKVLERWRETGPCRNGSPEQYVRKHWFRVLLVTGEELEIYCDRQARRGKNPKARWWVFAIKAPR